MARGNGKSEVDPQELDINHELPPSDGDDTQENQFASGPKAGVVEPQSDLQAEVHRLKAERDNLLDRLARLQAEFENARKRAAREQQEFREYALADAVKVLLPAMDSFERALHSASRVGDFRSGIELIYRQLQDALAKLGVTPIGAKGEPFNPHLHQAIEMVDSDEVEDQHVLEELQRGYKIKDRLLRPAMVRVAKNSRR
jgi:molecular chaperone GrpE